MAENEAHDNILMMTTEIVSAYVTNNQLKQDDLPRFIQAVAGSLAAIGGGGAGTPPTPTRGAPAVPVGKSVTPDFIVCLEDGKKLKMLKRHLRAEHDLSIEQYRTKWGLPADYPLVAPNYAKKRSRLAKQIGLGRGTKSRR